MRAEDKKILLFIGGMFVLNAIQSLTMDLAHDEAYYWVYSLQPSWGYYDHPPMVAWLIRAFSFLGKSEFAVRLPFIFLQSGTLWLLWGLAGKRNSAVFIASVLSFGLLQASGFLALPDTPLLFFSVLFWRLALLYRKSERWWTIPFLALTIACLFYSKYHGLLVVLVTTASMPDIARRRSFWGIVLLALIFYLPHLWWQSAHNFVSFDFHLNQRSGKGFDISNPVEFLAGQLVLGSVFPVLFGIAAALKLRKSQPTLFLNSAGFFFLILILSFRNRIEANWTVTAFAALLPLLCSALDSEKQRRWFVWLSCPGIILLLAARLALMPSWDSQGYLFDRMAEVKGWKARAGAIEEASQGLPLYAETYQLAAKLSFYGKELVPALSLCSRKSQFDLWELNYPQKDVKITYVGPKVMKEAKQVDIGYGKPVYVNSEILFQRLLKEREMNKNGACP